MTYAGSVSDGVNGVDGLSLVTGLALSRDPSRGEFLYASGFGDDSVAIFERQGDGTLSYIERVRDGIGGVDGIGGATAMAVSSDDQNVYVAGSVESTLAVFERDVVSPTSPTIISTSHGLGMPSNLTNLDFEWSGAADQGFGVADYWLLLDTAPDTVPPIGAPSLQVLRGAEPHTASLAAGDDDDGYHLHMAICDQIGNCSTAHLGPFLIDTLPPSAPSDLDSPTHGTPNPDPEITTTWTAALDPPAASGYASGVAGYAWDFLATDTPQCDGAIDGTALTTTSPTLDLGTWYFHICAVDVAGNAGTTAVLGPLVVADMLPPSVLLVDSVARTAVRSQAATKCRQR